MKPIVIPMEDPIIHTAQNNYSCWDITCPCHGAGELLYREREITTQRLRALRSDTVPTEQLPKPTIQIPDLDARPPQRRKRPWWRRWIVGP